MRRSFRLHVYGYVVMPEHVHLLLSEPQRDTSSGRTAALKPKDGLNGPPVLSEPRRDTLADALKSLKQGVSRRLIGDAERFWQKRYYDFNIRNYPQFVAKLRCIHRNPVKQGLCERPEDWQWSSFRHYATGAEERVEIESEWTARKRERAAGTLCPAVELNVTRLKTCLIVSPAIYAQLPVVARHSSKWRWLAGKAFEKPSKVVRKSGNLRTRLDARQEAGRQFSAYLG